MIPKNPVFSLRLSPESEQFSAWNASRRDPIALATLLTELDGLPAAPSLDAVAALVRRVVISPEEARERIRFDPRRYMRNPLAAGENFEALLLCWLPDQVSPIHDHADSACVFGVLSGKAVEIGFQRRAGGRLQASSITRLSTGDVVCSNGSDIHQVANWSRARAPLVTLHVYVPRLRAWNNYPESLVDRVDPSTIHGISAARFGHFRPASAG